MSMAEQAAAQVWWDSVYSPTTTRNAALNSRATVIAQRDALRAEIEAAMAKREKVDSAKRRELAQLELQSAGFESLYRALPEEVVAYDKGGAAGREAELMQHRAGASAGGRGAEDRPSRPQGDRARIPRGHRGRPGLRSAGRRRSRRGARGLEEAPGAGGRGGLQVARRDRGDGTGRRLLDGSVTAGPADPVGEPAPVAGGVAPLPGGSPGGVGPTGGETPADRLRDLGLADDQIKRLMDKVGLTEGRIRELHASLGAEGLTAIAASKSSAQMKRALEVQDRLAARGDPAVDAGLARLTEAGAGGVRAMDPLTAAELLHDVPVAELPAYLRVVGTEGFPHPARLRSEQRAALHDPNVLALIERFGPGVFRDLDGGAAPDPQDVGQAGQGCSPGDGRHAGRERARGADSRETAPRARRQPKPRRRHAVERVQADETDPLLPRGNYQKTAKEFVADHPEYLAEALAPDHEGKSLTREEVEHRLATLYQTRDLAKRGHYEGFSEARKLALLDDFDRQTRGAGLDGRWTGSRTTCAAR